MKTSTDRNQNVTLAVQQEALSAALDYVARDCEADSDEYLRETHVPNGGE